MADLAYLKRLELELLEKGKLIKSGFVSYRAAVGLANAGPVQIEETERAFMAGAQHVFASVMSLMTEDKEPNEEDYRRIGLIDAELFAWLEEFCKKNNLPPPKR